MRQYDDRKVVNHQEQTENKRKIVDVLESFGIRISSIQATVGPTVTLYEIVPEPAGGAHLDHDAAADLLDRQLRPCLESLLGISRAELRSQRYGKFRRMGAVAGL